MPLRAASTMRPTTISLLLSCAVAACSDAPVMPRSNPPRGPLDGAAAVVSPAGASVVVPVTVPVSMRGSPFNVSRSLTVPPGFAAAVYARIAGVRFLAATPDGNLLASNPGAGAIYLVRANAGGDPQITTFYSGLKGPQDMVFHAIGATTYLYVTESSQIDRFVYHTGDVTAQGRQILITGLPDESTPELMGAYEHALKNIALDGSDKLYVSIASSCNVCVSDTQSNPVRGAIYQYNADGSGGRLFARGIRNAEGLAVIPGTNILWIAVNNRDNVPYPYPNEPSNYGRVLQWYVDNHPPEEFTSVRDGGNYGWPFCNPMQDVPNGYDNMPFDLAYDMNADGHVNCQTMDRIVKGIQAHSAPLGLTFFQNTAVPSAYANGAAIALHGSWNRSTKTGYKVIFFPWDNVRQKPGAQLDLVTGWTDGSSNWGRPVDVAVDPKGAILVSDDNSGTIYKFTATTAPPPGQAVQSLTLIDADNSQPIAGYDPLLDGATLNLATLPSRRLSIRATTTPSPVGSVSFNYDGNATYHIENAVPYDIAGDASNGTVYNPWTPTDGSHTLIVTPYTLSNRGGATGTALTVHFTVTN